MTAGSRASSPSRVRRSHAERTAETRGRIIAAVVESIAEVGFQRTTAAEITRRAGVTWGAVQHHFGGKDGILFAVLEDSFDRFASQLADIEVEATPLDERIDLFIERAWDHFGSAHYRSTFEILLSHAGSSELEDDSLWQDQMFAAWNGIWSRLFADVRQPRRASLALQSFTISSLSGLGGLFIVAGRRAGRPSAELAVLKATLRRELGA